MYHKFAVLHNIVIFLLSLPNYTSASPFAVLLGILRTLVQNLPRIPTLISHLPLTRPISTSCISLDLQTVSYIFSDTVTFILVKGKGKVLLITYHAAQSYTSAKS